MVRQLEALFFSKCAHLAVEIITACKVEKRGAVFILWIDFNIYPSEKFFTWRLANAHIHLARIVFIL